MNQFLKNWIKGDDVRGRLADAEPVVVLDIGSNSVRLVVYERLSRALTPLFNEKASCALGRGVAATGRLADENVQLAIHAVRRFALITRLMNVRDVHIIATSAVREAENGPAFMAKVAELMGTEGRVLSGAEEAHFAALGVVSGIPGFEGVVGDLGGGSLEFSLVTKGEDAPGETMALGAIRLQDDSDMSPSRALKIAHKALADSNVVLPGAQKQFCAIGGTWRSLAKLLQIRQDYPLHMVQNYMAPASQMLDLCEELVKKGDETEGLEQVSGSRRPLLPYGAAAMAAVIERGGFEEVYFSALGVREGYLYAQLPDAEKEQHPLREATSAFNQLRSRTPSYANDLFEFTSRFFDTTGLLESGHDTLCREAACNLSDIGWRGHPDYRGEQSVDLVAYSALTGIDHPGRAFIAEALAVRYMGLKHNSISQDLIDLAGEHGHQRARIIGALFRLAYVLAAAVPEILPRLDFRVSGKVLEILIPEEIAFLDSVRLRSRMKQLNSLLDYENIDLIPV